MLAVCVAALQWVRYGTGAPTVDVCTVVAEAPVHGVMSFRLMFHVDAERVVSSCECLKVTRSSARMAIGIVRCTNKPAFVTPGVFVDWSGGHRFVPIPCPS